jgi:hypothetical protein
MAPTAPWRTAFRRSCARRRDVSPAPELIVRVIACLAEDLGIRGTTRGFESDPNTVLSWLGEAAEQLKAFSASFLHELHVNQVPLDELYAVLSQVRAPQLCEGNDYQVSVIFIERFGSATRISPMADMQYWHIPPWVSNIATLLRPYAPSGHQGLCALPVVLMAG